MNTQVRDWELTIILLASTLTILTVLYIVGKWLNFHILACCFDWARNRKTSTTTVSVREQSTQVEIAFEQKKKQLYKSCLFFRNLWRHLLILVQLTNR
jgi:hypothetical protein